VIVGSIARRYAKALLAIGIEDKTFEKLGSELHRFAALMDNKDLRETLENPSYPLSKRKAIIEQLIARLIPSKTIKSFLLLLADRNRFGVLPGIAREYQKMVDEHAGRVRADVTSAQQLDADDVTRLKQALEKKTQMQVLLQQHTDPELIAGMVTQIGSIVYDGSIRTRLSQMRQTLLEGEQ
jgi:F-type H+-transporting ATPase subunit delta